MYAIRSSLGMTQIFRSNGKKIFGCRFLEKCTPQVSENLIKRDFDYYKIGRHLGDAPASSSNDSIVAGNGFI